MGGSGDEALGLELALGTLDGHPADAEIPSCGRVRGEVEMVAIPGDLSHVPQEAFRPAAEFVIRCGWYALTAFLLVGGSGLGGAWLV